MSNSMSLQIIGAGKEIAEFNLNLNGIKEVYEEIRSAQDEVGGTVTYKAKVPSGGGKAFDIITGDESMDTSIPNFTGVIIHNHKCNAYFGTDNTSTNLPPICSSIDGSWGIEAEGGSAKSCATCEYNEYGTARNGRGKACKNMHRIYVLTQGSPIPIMLVLPPTSLKNWQNYRLSVLATKKLKPQDVATEFSLSVETSADGIKYSVVKFKLLGKLDPAMAGVAAYFSNSFKPVIEVSEDDYNSHSYNNPSASHFETLGADESLN